MKLPSDVQTYIRARFSSGEREVATRMLLAASLHTGAFPEDRLLRCAVVASGGDIVKLQYYAGMLAIDFRDVIVAGEYVVQDQKLTRIRNLSEPILDH